MHEQHVTVVQVSFCIEQSIGKFILLAPLTGMLGWAASAHCLTEQFHSTQFSH